MGPPDPILGITVAYLNDKSENKINLGVGAYRDDNGKPFILPSVHLAEQKISSKNMDKEYLPITGLKSFRDDVIKLAFSDSGNVVKENRYASTQSISGTGGLRIGGEYISKFGNPNSKNIYLPSPSWGNHTPIFKDSGLNIKSYSYYNPDGCNLDFNKQCTDILNIPEGSTILLHACAHNPTGVDPNNEQWKELSEIIKKKKLLPFFDMAYQGFASGNVNNDAFALRQFVDDGHNVLLSQSFAKNFGLYAERIGAFTVIAKDAEIADKVESQLKILIRPMYSNPPISGARIITEILNDSELNKIWLNDVKTMADRIINMRSLLKSGLENFGSTKNWEHITSQIGMFCYTGLEKSQVIELRDMYHIYLTMDGRISMAGVTSKNVEYLSKAMHEVSR